MIACLRHTAAWLLLLLHLSGAAAMELGHRHHDALPAGEAAVSSHNCGTHEKHIRAEWVVQCPACSPGSIGAAFPVAPVPGTGSPARGVIPGDAREPLPPAPPFLCGTRAPPHATS